MIKRVVFPSGWLPWALLLPQLAVVAVFFYWPAVQALYQSVFIQDAFGGNPEFVGLENFARLFADPLYLNAMRVTAVFSLSATVIGLVFSLTLAYFADRAMRARLLLRTLLIWPYAVAWAIAGVLWMFLFNPTLGVVTHWLRGLGVTWNHVLDGDQAMLLIIMATVWKQISYNFIFFAAGLAGIPPSLIEAAAIDGAGPWTRTWCIVLPLLSPTLFLLLVLNVIYAFFDTLAVIDLTTQGRPAGETMTLIYRVYRDGFVGLDLGASSAQSVLLMLAVVGLTWLQFRVLERRVHYAG